MKIELEFFDARCYFPQPGDLLIVKSTEGFWHMARYWDRDRYYPARFVDNHGKQMTNIALWARLPA